MLTTLGLGSLLLADITIGGGIISGIILLIVILGALAIFWVTIKQMEVTIPPFIIAIFWIVLAVMIGIAAIKLIASTMSSNSPSVNTPKVSIPEVKSPEVRHPDRTERNPYGNNPYDRSQQE